MRRRDFMHLGVLAAAGLAGGCTLSYEQGLFNECRAAIGEGPARELVGKAWTGLRADQVWDVHVHLFGNGRSESGIFVDPALDRGNGPIAKARRAFFMNAGCVGDDEERMDQGMVARLVALADQMPRGARLMLLAFDFAHDEDGRKREDLTTFAVPNEYAQRVAASRPDRFEWIASVHPCRPDALERLAAAKQGGARAVKWLPPAMAIDMAGRRSAAFYEALRRHDLPLLVHVGDEQAVPGAQRSELGNPLLLRHPLEAGVRVIAAHCGTLGESADLDAGKNPEKARKVKNFELFSRLMGEKRYDGLLFADISAVTQANRAENVPAILAKREWHTRLLNGSDYPLPGVMPIFSMKSLVSLGVLDEGLIPRLREIREANAVLFDFVLKRNLRSGAASFPASVFETRPFFERT